MTGTKPYIDHTFTGVSSFTETLDRTLVSYRVLNDDSLDSIFDTEKNILTRDRDTLTLGECSAKGRTLYFLDCGLMVSPDIRSHLVFIFDHRPSGGELRQTARDMEELTVERLKTRHGDTISDIEELDAIDESRKC